LLVEGSLLGGYEFGLEMAAKLAVEIARQADLAHSHNIMQAMELVVVGKVAPHVRLRWQGWLAEQTLKIPVQWNWLGIIPNVEIPQVDRSAHLLFSSDINAACPNSVIEAMACGTPVIAFDTGALAEMIADQAGLTVPYGGNPWKLEPPDIPALARAALDVFSDPGRYRAGARKRAEAIFDVNRMVDRYLKAIQAD
jgi:glycosyltransferase involved in cell wall biosynthesis